MHMCSALSTTPTPRGRELLLQPVGDLHRHALLQLQVAGERLDDARELREPDDALARQVRHVGHAMERQQVVHAQRLERDVADQDELVVALVAGTAVAPNSAGVTSSANEAATRRGVSSSSG